MAREPGLFAPAAADPSAIAAARPLADRMRPATLEEFVGQEHLLGEGRAFREAIRRGEIGSMIFWGPPGSGKTTLAFLVARYTDREFVPFSAVTQGVPRVREIIAEAELRLLHQGRRTILFCDEIHRFNRAQQDAFLPHVERGTIALIGATTENPSFELTGALLSRCRVLVLEPLSEAHIATLVRRALDDEANGLGTLGLAIDDDALRLLCREADGDARRALQALEAAAEYVSGHGRTGAQGDGGMVAPRHEGEAADRASVPRCLRAADIAEALQRRFAKYDKGGEEHYNLISALHKAMRGSDPEGSLYWLARMIAGGEDPLFIARRVVRAAAEDVGLADPRALDVALAAKEAFHFLGQPEGELALAEAVLYVATAPKSNRVYAAWEAARRAADEHPAEGVPLHIRNAPTKLMEELGYGRGYRYAHQSEDAYLPQEYLPPVLRGSRWYRPTAFGFEKEIGRRIEWWEKLKREAAGSAQPD